MTAMTEVRPSSMHIYTLSESNSIAGIRKATSWYNSHITLARPPIRNQPKPPVTTAVLLTDDVANRQKAEADGLTAVSGTRPSSSIVILLFIMLDNSSPLRGRSQGL